MRERYEMENEFSESFFFFWIKKNHDWFASLAHLFIHSRTVWVPGLGGDAVPVRWGEMLPTLQELSGGEERPTFSHLTTLTQEVKSCHSGFLPKSFFWGYVHTKTQIWVLSPREIQASLSSLPQFLSIVHLTDRNSSCLWDSGGTVFFSCLFPASFSGPRGSRLWQLSLE